MAEGQEASWKALEQSLPPINARPTHSAATLAVHADDPVNVNPDVAPPLHVSTTFRYSHDPEELIPLAIPKDGVATHVYSRLSGPNSNRLETLLSALMNGYALSYASGLAAFHALLVFTNPKVIAIGEGYHGCHGVIRLHEKLKGLRSVDLHDESSWDAAELGSGDIVHVETPLNPTGEAYPLATFAERAHKRGAFLTVDATLGPPGLQDPFLHGADFVMHSGTKYIGGHSDMLCGVLAVKRKEWYVGLWQERMYLGSVMGSLEGWLGVRSVRTLQLRVQAQSRNAGQLVRWLDGVLRGQEDGEGCRIIREVVHRVQHASLQATDMDWLTKQMPNGFGPVFALWMKSPDLARALPSKLSLFQHATSLGGVESLIEWRRMSDEDVDARLVRISVGIEDWKDLKADLLEAFKAISSR